VDFSTSGGYPNTMKVYMSTTTPGSPTIFYTVSNTDPAPDPTHTGSTPGSGTNVYSGPVNVIAGVHKFFRAIVYQAGYGDSVAMDFDADNTNTGGGMGPMGPSATTTIFSVWDGDWAILEEYDASGNRVQGYVQGYHGLVKTLVDNIYYYQDELGSTSHIASASGALLEYYKYDLYGKPRYFNAAGSELQASSYQVADLGNGGSRWMPQLGLYDDRNRFMSPDLGRFLQPDPIGFKGDASNLYRYCGNDWANKTDPTGLDDTNLGLKYDTENGAKVEENAKLEGDSRKNNSPWAGIEKDQLRSCVYAPTANSVERQVQREIADAPKFAQAGHGVDPQTAAAHAAATDTITVSAYTGAGGAGHVGIGVDSARTEGLYPARENVTERLKIATGKDVPATVHEDTARRTDTITIHVTRVQAEHVRDYVEAAHPPHSGMYNLYGRNCARFVKGALGTGNLRSSNTMYPHDLMTQLHTLYDNQ
jgi:RHS repeat-associated protein